MQSITAFKSRVSRALTKLDDKLGFGLVDHPERDDGFLRTPIIDWTSVAEDRLAHFLRSDELPRFEMLSFRKEQLKFWGCVKHWKSRDDAISACRAALGLPVVSELAAKSSAWAKTHRKADAQRKHYSGTPFGLDIDGLNDRFADSKFLGWMDRLAGHPEATEFRKLDRERRRMGPPGRGPTPPQG